MIQLEKKSTRYSDAVGKGLSAILGLMILILISSCSSLKLSTMYYDPIYGPEEVVLEVPSDVKVDTLSYSQLRWKLRTDSRFRWDFAQYAMDQPYSWYTSNYSFSHWRPFTSFDVYWNRYQFWNDWAFNYPFFDYGWGYNSWGWNHSIWNHWNYGWAWNWHRPYRPWNSWYNGPWSNPSYNVIWNASRRNVAYVRGARGGRNIDYGGNSNIENIISTRYNKPRNNVNNNNNVINNIINNLRSNGNRVRVYDNPNDIPNNNVIRYNNGRPVVPNNNSINNNSRPVHNWNNNTINSRPSRPVYNNSNNSNISRGSSNISRGSSSSSSSGRSSGGSSGGSSRGGRNN